MNNEGVRLRRTDFKIIGADNARLYTLSIDYILKSSPVRAIPQSFIIHH